MPQVPYTPYPDVRARDDPAQGPRIDAPGAAFGVNIGEAIERRLGTGLEKFGDDFYREAMRQQELLNQTSAREAQNNYALQSSMLQAKYDALVGNDKVGALPGHLKTLSDLRVSLGAGLNPMAKRMYDSDTMPFMQRNMFSAAASSAKAAKDYSLATDTATLALEKQKGEDHPDFDPITQAEKIGNLAKDVARGHHGEGLKDDDPILQAASKEAISDYIYKRASGYLNRGDVNRAEEIEKEAIKKGELTPDDQDKLDNKKQGVATGRYADTITQKIYSENLLPDGTYKKTTAQMIEDGRAEAAKHPDLVHLPKAVADRITWETESNIRAARLDRVTTDQQITEFVLKNDVHSPQEFVDKGGGALAKKLEVSKRGEYLGEIINKTWHGVGKTSNDIMMNTVRAMKDSGQLEDLLKINPDDPRYNFSYGNKDEVRKLQAAALKDPTGDPRVKKAWSLMLNNYGAELADLGVANRDAKDPSDYWHFRGVLTEALQAWQERTGKPPSEEEIKDVIGPRIMRTQAETKGFWSFFSGKEPAFKQWPTVVEPPLEFVQKRLQDLADRGLPAPSDAEVLQAYRRQLYEDLFSGQKVTKPAKPLKPAPTEPAGGGPTVPRSE